MQNVVPAREISRCRQINAECRMRVRVPRGDGSQTTECRENAECRIQKVKPRGSGSAPQKSETENAQISHFDIV
eukprot:695312-Prymnesium_polylepis.1